MKVNVNVDLFRRFSPSNKLDMESVRINGVEIVSSNDGISAGIVFNNLTGKNLTGQEWLDYLKCMQNMNPDVKPGKAELVKAGVVLKEGQVPSFVRGAGRFF